MDPSERDDILKQLYADADFAALNDCNNTNNLKNEEKEEEGSSSRIRAQLEYILVKYYDCPSLVAGENESSGEARDAWLLSQLKAVQGRLAAWNQKVNRKSYTEAKKHRKAARKALETLAKRTAEASSGSSAKIEPSEVRDHLRQAERHLSKALLQTPYSPQEIIDSEVDRLLALKFSLHSERASVRFRLGLLRAAAVDARMALTAAETLQENNALSASCSPKPQLPQISAGCVEEVKILAVRCLAGLGLLKVGEEEEEEEEDGEKVDVEKVIDCITFTKEMNDGDPKAADKKEAAQEVVFELAKKLEKLHDSDSNFHVRNAPTLGGLAYPTGEPFFRYQADLASIEIKEAAHKGRYFVAAAPIMAGTWLLVEKPYSSVVHKDFLATTCNYCLKELMVKTEGGGGEEEEEEEEAGEALEEKDNGDKAANQNVSLGLPCDFCTEVRYCSPDCAEEAYNAYHRHECGFLGFLLKAGPLAGVHTYRIIAKTGLEEALAEWKSKNNKEDKDNNKEYGTSSLNEYLEAVALRTTSDLDALTDPAHRRLLFRMSTSLAVHPQAYSASWTAWHAFQALDAALVLLLRNRALLKKVQKEGEASSSPGAAFRLLLDVFELALEQVRRITVNVFGKFDYGGPKKRNIATGQIFVGSLVNHSCAPNVEWSWSAGHVVFKASRDIAAGEELNITYGQTKSTPFQDRQEALQQHYHFLCGCRLCRADLVGGNSGKGSGENGQLVARCQSCNQGPLVSADGHAGCLDCYAETSPKEVASAVAELAKARASLAYQAKMLSRASLSTATAGDKGGGGGKIAQLIKRKSLNLTVSVLSALQSAESSLRTLAYRPSAPFTATLCLLGRLYLQMDELRAAVRLCPLAEEAEAAISTFHAQQQSGVTSSSEGPPPPSPPPKMTTAEMEDKLSQLAVWTEVGRQFYLAYLVVEGNDGEKQQKSFLEKQESSSGVGQAEEQAVTKLYLRYFKLAIAYITARTKGDGDGLKVCELLKQPAYADAKLVFMLAEQKKAELWAMVEPQS